MYVTRVRWAFIVQAPQLHSNLATWDWAAASSSSSIPSEWWWYVNIIRCKYARWMNDGTGNDYIKFIITQPLHIARRV